MTLFASYKRCQRHVKSPFRDHKAQNWQYRFHYFRKYKILAKIYHFIFGYESKQNKNLRDLFENYFHLGTYALLYFLLKLYYLNGHNIKVNSPITYSIYLK